MQGSRRARMLVLGAVLACGARSALGSMSIVSGTLHAESQANNMGVHVTDMPVDKTFTTFSTTHSTSSTATNFANPLLPVAQANGQVTLSETAGVVTNRSVTLSASSFIDSNAGGQSFCEVFMSGSFQLSVAGLNYVTASMDQAQGVTQYPPGVVNIVNSSAVTVATFNQNLQSSQVVLPAGLYTVNWTYDAHPQSFTGGDGHMLFTMVPTVPEPAVGVAAGVLGLMGVRRRGRLLH